MKRIPFFILMMLFSLTIVNNSFASSPKSVVVQCLKEVKGGNYANSYTHFSSSLKKDVSLDLHVSTLKTIGSSYGRLISFSDRHPLFKNYFLDEDMFKGLFSKKKQLAFKYFLNFENGMMSLYAEVEKEGEEYKIKVFYMEEICNNADNTCVEDSASATGSAGPN